MLLAVAKTKLVGDQAGHFKTETKMFRRLRQPVVHGFRAGGVIKGGVDFHGGKMTGIKLKPLSLREMCGIKDVAPIVVTPCTGSDFDFLLCSGIQSGCILNPAPTYLNRTPAESGFKGRTSHLTSIFPSISVTRL